MPGKGCLARKSTLKKLKRVAEEQALEAGASEQKAKAARELPPEVKSNPEAAWEALKAMGPRQFAFVPEEAPEFSTLWGDARAKAVRLCHAAFRGLSAAGGSMSLQQIRVNARVSEIMKDETFKKQRFVDLLKRHSDVFEVNENGEVNSHLWRVSITPSGLSYLPDLELYKQDNAAAEMLASTLPQKITSPKGPLEQVQALKIALVHALTNRGGTAMLQDLGQEPDVLERKGVLQGKSLQELIKVNANIFQTENLGEGNVQVALLNPDCDLDSDATEAFLAAAPRKPFYGKDGKGKGKSSKGKHGGEIEAFQGNSRGGSSKGGGNNMMMQMMQMQECMNTMAMMNMMNMAQNASPQDMKQMQRMMRSMNGF